MFLFSILGFAAQVCVICISIALFVDMHSIVSAEHDALVSVVSLPQSDVVDDVNDSDATLSDTARVTCAKSMASPVYVTTIDESSVSPDDYSAMTVVALKALCKSRGVKRYSSLRKSDLVELLSAL